jgi:PH domain
MVVQGGSWKNWKRRWFVLTDRCLYYFQHTAENVPKVCLISTFHKLIFLPNAAAFPSPYALLVNRYSQNISNAFLPKNEMPPFDKFGHPTNVYIFCIYPYLNFNFDL